MRLLTAGSLVRVQLGEPVTGIAVTNIVAAILILIMMTWAFSSVG